MRPRRSTAPRSHSFMMLNDFANQNRITTTTTRTGSQLSIFPPQKVQTNSVCSPDLPLAQLAHASLRALALSPTLPQESPALKRLSTALRASESFLRRPQEPVSLQHL